MAPTTSQCELLIGDVMKIILGLIGLATLMLTSGCIIEPRGRAYGAYEGEYPHRYYGGDRYEFRYYHHPYDRDHYWR